RNAPLVVNLGYLPDPEQVDLQSLLALMEQQGFIPVGITNGTEVQQQQARAMKLAVLTMRGSERTQEEQGEQEGIQAEKKVKENPRNRNLCLLKKRLPCQKKLCRQPLLLLNLYDQGNGWLLTRAILLCWLRLVLELRLWRLAIFMSTALCVVEFLLATQTTPRHAYFVSS
ncbi:MAG: hypothetical protein D3918_12035, partial [Candidatus Electrothrix sp. AX2]|nr:hypothetical protein [Candidatus Electrothrix gigas]